PRPAAGPAEADRAGRDDLGQVRAPGDRLPEPRGGALRDGAERLPRDRAPRPGPAGAGAARPALGALARDIALARVGARRLRRLLPGLHPRRRARAAGARLAARAAAGGRRLPRLPPRDPLDLRLDAEPDAPPRLVRLRHCVRRRRTVRARLALR